MENDDTRRLLALCAIRVEGASTDWSLIAREAQLAGGLDRLYSGDLVERSAAADKFRPVLRYGLAHQLPDAIRRVDDELRLAEQAGAQLATVLDETYPANLRLVPNLPPFLFVRGELRPDDALSVAVVGTREASPDGLSRAARMASLLAERSITVTSGLAAGIDTAAHSAALDTDGRTIAVLGTGITRCYPAENQRLMDQVAERGAVASQFWPSTPPARWTFPRRNVVTSGISQGTVVIEASSTSGAKMQARLALEHGKTVFLIDSLVTSQPWARKYLGRGAILVRDVADVADNLAPADRVLQAAEQQHQLAFAL